MLNYTFQVSWLFTFLSHSKSERAGRKQGREEARSEERTGRRVLSKITLHRNPVPVLRPRNVFIFFRPPLLSRLPLPYLARRCFPVRNKPAVKHLTLSPEVQPPPRRGRRLATALAPLGFLPGLSPLGRSHQTGTNGKAQREPVAGSGHTNLQVPSEEDLILPGSADWGCHGNFLGGISNETEAFEGWERVG